MLLITIERHCKIKYYSPNIYEKIRLVASYLCVLFIVFMFIVNLFTNTLQNVRKEKIYVLIPFSILCILMLFTKKINYELPKKY